MQSRGAAWPWLGRGGATAATRSEIGLDWLNFFVANLQTAFGPFVSVYLTAQAWTQGEIGLVLSIGTITAMASQVPAGALVDALASKRAAAGAAILAIIAGSLLLALFPALLPVTIAEVLHGFASCMLTPAIAAISLIVAGERAGALGERLGRNARFASIGNGAAAALMGGCGYYVSNRAVFLLGAGLAVPGLLALKMIAPAPAAAALAGAPLPATSRESPWRLLRDRRLLGFALCIAFFHLGNAAMLPLAASEATARVGSEAQLIIAACIVVPQAVVALLSPWVGRSADRLGRRPLLLLGFSALPLRGVLLATTRDPLLLVAIQLLDGLAGAVFGVMLPLVTADLTRNTGRFNLCMGVFGLSIGGAATLSTMLGGIIADRSPTDAFLALAAAGLVSVLLVALVMPETRPPA